VPGWVIWAIAALALAVGEIRRAAAIHEGDADPKLLAYLQVLPQSAQGESNKVWIIPSEFTQALGQLGSSIMPGGNASKGG
jgi:hypothetical protein